MHPVAKPKFFKRQSGQIRAVCAEVQAILDATKEVCEKVSSDPPPPIAARQRDPEAGTYCLTSGQVEEEQVLVPPVERAPAPRPRPRTQSKPEIQAPRKKMGSFSNEG